MHIVLSFLYLVVDRALSLFSDLIWNPISGDGARPQEVSMRATPATLLESTTSTVRHRFQGAA